MELLHCIFQLLPNKFWKRGQLAKFALVSLSLSLSPLFHSIYTNINTHLRNDVGQILQFNFDIFM